MEEIGQGILSAVNGLHQQCTSTDCHSITTPTYMANGRALGLGDVIKDVDSAGASVKRTPVLLVADSEGSMDSMVKKCSMGVRQAGIRSSS